VRCNYVRLQATKVKLNELSNDGMVFLCSFPDNVKFHFPTNSQITKAKLLRKGAQLGNLLILRVECIASISAIVEQVKFFDTFKFRYKNEFYHSMKRLGQIFWHI